MAAPYDGSTALPHDDGAATAAGRYLWGLWDATNSVFRAPGAVPGYRQQKITLYDTAGNALLTVGQRAQPAFYFDRNIATQFVRYDVDSVAPHVATVRATREIPAGKLAIVECVFVRLVRATVATTPGISARGFGEIRRAGLSNPMCGLDLDASAVGNVVGFGKSLAVAPMALAIAGDIIEIVTKDDNIGGTVHYSIMIKLTEFDV